MSSTLFGIMMNLFIHGTYIDLIAAICNEAQAAHEIKFADDMSIVDETRKYAEVYMQCIQRQGACYGLSSKWDKFMMICINCNHSIPKPDGSLVHISYSMIYLSGLISDDFRSESSYWYGIW